MLFLVCNHETWRRFVGGQNNDFLHNLHETDKSLVPSGGNALVLGRFPFRKKTGNFDGSKSGISDW